VLNSRFVALACLVLLSCYFLLFVYQYGVNVPLLDDWDAVALVGKLRNGSISFKDLFALHNEHRIFFPNLVMLVNGAYFSFNMKLQMYLSAVLWIFLCWLLVANFPDVSKGRLAYSALIVPFILLNVKQSQNFLWGFQITFVSALVLPIISFYLLRGEAGRQIGSVRFTAAILLGIVASFSCLHGLFVWPAGLLLLSGQRKYLTYWVAVGIIVWFSYFYGYQSPSHHPSVTLAVTSPVASLMFLACLVGNLVAGSDYYALFLGAIFLGLFSALLFVAPEGGRTAENAFWRATALFSLTALSAITVGRIGLGLDTAFSSRYVTFSALFLVAVLALGVLAASTRKWPRFAVVAMVASVTLALPMSYQEGVVVAKSRLVLHQQLYSLLPFYRSVDCETLTPLFNPNCQVVMDRAPILEAIGFGAFK
jgi:hypothetical protein